METTFCELRGKEVINVSDGKRLGRIIDIVFETNCGKVLGFIVPCYNRSWNIFKNADDIFIPFNNVCKFGDDVILVNVFVPNRHPPIHGKGKAQFTRTSTLSVPQNVNSKFNEGEVIQNSIQIDTNFNQQNSANIYPKDINQ